MQHGNDGLFDMKQLLGLKHTHSPLQKCKKTPGHSRELTIPSLSPLWMPKPPQQAVRRGRLSIIKLPVVTADGQRMAQEQFHVSIHAVVHGVHHQMGQ